MVKIASGIQQIGNLQNKTLKNKKVSFTAKGDVLEKGISTLIECPSGLKIKPPAPPKLPMHPEPLDINDPKELVTKIVKFAVKYVINPFYPMF